MTASTHPDHREGNGYQIIRAQPHPLLRRYATEYQGYVNVSAVRRRDVHVAFPGLPMVISFLSDPILIDSNVSIGEIETRRSFIAGMHDTFSASESPMAMYGAQVNFTPIGGYLLVGLPMHELTNRTVEIDDVFGAQAPLLVERLAEAGDWGERFSVLDSFIGRRIAKARRPAPGVVWAWRRLEETGGAIPVAELASELGISRKHLVARFREQVGLPPKTLARVLRFDRAVRRIQDGAGWSQTAIESGYYDQAHLIRDFRQFTGFTPVQYAARGNADGGLRGD